MPTSKFTGMLDTVTEHTINVTGNACNINGHPALVAENVGVFFIEDMPEWEAHWENKRIRAIGNLQLHADAKQNIISKPVVQLLR